MSILIQNTLAYLGETLQPKRCDILIDDAGLIAAITEANEQSTDNHRLIDGSAYVAAPAFTDLHVHFREPGFEHKETLATGSLAAIKGGVTTVCTMPNTQPPIDRPERLGSYLEKTSQIQGLNILPSVAITLNQAGQVMTELEAMAAQGAAAFTDDGRTVMSEVILTEALKVSDKTGKVVMTHSEDHKAAVNYPNGPYPPEVESDIVRRDIALLEALGQGHLHIAHLSTAGALDAVRSGKAKGLKVTCEMAPHHLYFDATQLSFETAAYKVNPPLRDEGNRQQLIDGIRAGIVDAIASDHAPHEAESKSAPYGKGTYGFTGLETLFAATYTVFQEAGLPLDQLLAMLSTNPRRILGQPSNHIDIGQTADLVLLDLEKQWTLNKADLVSKSKNSPWDGKVLKGQVTYVIKNTDILLEKGAFPWPSND